MIRYTVGIDTGGTFTDFVLVDHQDSYETHKTPSTPQDPSIAIMRGLQQIAESKSLSLASFLQEVDLIVHGTTVTTNAVLTGTGAKTALLTTEGFRDILEMRRGIRPTLYNNKYTPPQPLVPRHRRYAIRERIAADGTVVLPLKEEDVVALGKELEKQKIEAIAVCFMHSYLAPDHEERAKNILQKLFPEAYLSVSHEILPQPRFHERVSTTVLNAYLGPVLQQYQDSLLERLTENHFHGTFLIITSNGGVASSGMVKQAPVCTLLSGPAAGPIATLALSEIYGVQNALTIDMGGTSFEASLIRDGIPQISHHTEINTHTTSLPMMDIMSIGAGGGSIAWLDSAGLLHMGPQSAGAVPGPAAYDLGGTEPTCTDASLVLGLLDAKSFLHSQFPLSVQKARQAIEHKIARPLGISVEEAASGMYQVITTNMANCLKEITMGKGYDPREFLLVVGGGAGPLHCAFLAEELEIPLMLIPAESSVLCASGMMLSDFKYDYVKTFHSQCTKSTLTEILLRLHDMLLQAKQDLAPLQHLINDTDAQYSLDIRYQGQHTELTIPFRITDLENDGWACILQSFHQEHYRMFGYTSDDPDVPIEIICLRLSYIGKRNIKLPLRRLSLTDQPMLLNYRQVYLPNKKTAESVAVWNGSGPTNQILQGPALIEKGNTTILIPEHYSGKYDPYGNLFLFQNSKEAMVLKMIAANN